MVETVRRQILETPITMSVNKLLEVAPNFTEYVRAKVFLNTRSQPTAAPELVQQLAISKIIQPAIQPTSIFSSTLSSKGSQIHPNLIVGAVDNERGLPVISV